MGKRVLVVDDEEDVEQFVSMILENAGYEVQCAGDGEQALRKIETQRPDLVVLDLMMPKVNGWEVLERLHSAGAPPPVVVILSALDDHERARRNGAVASVGKPFDVGQLLATCARALAGPV